MIKEIIHKNNEMILDNLTKMTGKTKKKRNN